MMDPLSISASVIALIQATNKVVSLCYTYTAAAKGAARAITQILDEIKSLRNVLESLEQLLRSDDYGELAIRLQLESIKTLCDFKDGPIAKEMKYLEEKLRPPEWAGRDGSRRQYIAQSLAWPLRERDTRKTLYNIEKLKGTLKLALTIDQKAMLMDIRHTQNRYFVSLDQSLKSLHNDERASEIFRWLSAPDPSINLNAARKRRHADTGLWLLRNKRFQDWKAAPGSFLWLHGIPGCGKTVLSSTIVDNLIGNDPNNATAYFYFDFNDGAKQYTDKMLRSLVTQLISNNHSNLEPLYALFKSCHDGAKAPLTEELEIVLKALIEQSHITFIVLDALDECEDRLVLIDFIEKVMRWKTRKLNIVMTSRKLKDFEDFFDTELEESSKLSIQNAKVDEDIRAYVHGKLRSDKRFKRWQKQPNVFEEIETKLMEKSGGMFRWASCQLDVLSGSITLVKLRQALDSLPKTLNETYERILCSIDLSFKDEALRILQWLTYAGRPLSLEEVAEILAFDVDKNDITFNRENRLPEPKEVLSICCGLVIGIDVRVKGTDQENYNYEDVYNEDVHDDSADQDSEDEEDTHDNITAKSTAARSKRTTVRLAHFSVKEYLISHRILEGKAAAFGIDEQDSNGVIGSTSLSCLLLFDSASFSDAEEFSNEFPLAQYSAEHWSEHLLVNSAEAHPRLYALAIKLFQSEDKLRNSITLYDFDDRIRPLHSWLDWPAKSAGSPLYYAVLTRLKALVEMLIEIEESKAGQVKACYIDRSIQSATNDQTDASHYKSERAFINARGGLLFTPLQAASFLGDKSIVTLLIEHGAMPNVFEVSGGTSALFAASFSGHIDIVELLLDAGADVHERVPPEALEGSKENNEESCDIIKNSETNVVAIVENREESSISSKEMAYLAKYKQDNVPLFDTADRYAFVQKRRFALEAAAVEGHTNIVKLLLDRGAMISRRSWPLGVTALHMASNFGHNEVVHLLLKRGAFVDESDMNGATALMYACDHRKSSTMRILLKMGADCNNISTQPGAAMINAIYNRSDENVKLLLDYGADIRIIHIIAGSFLRAAVVTGCEPTVRILIEHGADPNEDWPLIEALRRGYKDIAKLLIGNKANVNAVQSFTIEDGLPCWLYTLPATRQFVEKLLDFHGIYKLCVRPKKSIPSKQQQQYLWEDSPLWVAAAIGDEESVKSLLENGANLNQYGAYGITPLQIATIEEHEVIMQLLAAASDGSYPKHECFEEGGLVRPILGETLNSLQFYDNFQHSRMDGRRRETQVEGPIAIQPAEGSTPSEYTALHRPRSSHSVSILPSASLSMPCSTVLEVQDEKGHKLTLDLLKLLTESKFTGKAEGDEKYRNISSMCEDAMQRLWITGLKFESVEDLSKGERVCEV